jgi:peptide/nickel transport system ATP-binding protein
MEKGTVEEIFGGATHPYTEALISAIRSTKPQGAELGRITLTGDTPSPIDVPPGCRFASRCHRKVGSICDREPPPIRRMSATHEIACHIPMEALETSRHPGEARDLS